LFPFVFVAVVVVSFLLIIARADLVLWKENHIELFYMEQVMLMYAPIWLPVQFMRSAILSFYLKYGHLF